MSAFTLETEKLQRLAQLTQRMPSREDKQAILYVTNLSLALIKMLEQEVKTTSKLREQLSRSATVCPHEGCMLWKGHSEEHADQKTVSEALNWLAAVRSEV